MRARRLWSDLPQVRIGGGSPLGCPTWVYPQVKNLAQIPEEEPIALEQLGGSCRTQYGYSAAPSHHASRALLAALSLPLLSLYLL